MRKNRKIAMIVAAVLGISSLSAMVSASDSEEKNLRIAYGNTITSTDPAAGGETMLKELAGVCETLTYTNSDFTIQPMLATEWKQIDDRTWQFKLRENVTFHDGTPFNAEAVKWCLERAMELNSSLIGYTDMAGVEVVDDHTVNIMTNEPNTEIPQIMGYVGTALIAPTSVDEEGNFVQPIGTGYFKAKDFDEVSGTFTCEAYDGYWGDVDTSVTERTILSMPDSSARSLALQNGEVDVVSDIPFSDLEMLSNDENVKVSKFNTARTYFYEFNCASGAMADENVRKAVAYSLNKEEIVNDVLMGVGEVPEGIMMSDMPWTNTDVEKYEYNPEKAKELLGEAGYEDTDGDGYVDKDGEKLSVHIISYPGRPGCPLIVQATQGYLAEIGIDTEVEIIDWSALEEQKSAGNFDMILNSASAAYIPTPEYYMDITYVKAETGYQNEEINELIAQSYQTSDIEEKYDLCKKAQEIAQNDCGAYTVALYGAVFGLNPAVENFDYNAAAHDFIVPYNTDLK